MRRVASGIGHNRKKSKVWIVEGAVGDKAVGGAVGGAETTSLMRVASFSKKRSWLHQDDGEMHQKDGWRRWS
jgi:hypothetical protein